MMGMKRNAAVEFYRALLMFGICLLHACGNTGAPSSVVLDNVLRQCMPGFVFITGWFGMRFSLRKLVGLYGIAAYAVVVDLCVAWLAWRQMPTVGMFVELFRNIWFLNAYAVLMLFSPLLNMAVEEIGQGCGAATSWKSRLRNVASSERMKVIWPLLGLTFVWIWLHQVSGIARLMPVLSGVSNFSGLMMIGVYLVGRIIRLCEVESRIGSGVLCCCFAVCLGLTSFGRGFQTYASPIALMSVASLFFLVKRLRFAHAIGERISWIGPSLLTVYLLHARKDIGFRLMGDLKGWFVGLGCPDVCVWLAVACIVFSGGALAGPRRIFVSVARSSLKKS